MDRNNSLPKLNSSQICNILTLRYDPSQTPILPKLSWSDFVPHTDDVTTLEEIESIIKKSLEDNLLDENKISLALSGGIDSTLVLSMLKKFLPEKEIEAFSVQFANSVDETSTSKKISEHFDINYNNLKVLSQNTNMKLLRLRADMILMKSKTLKRNYQLNKKSLITH